MSGSPKYSQAELERQRQEKLEANRRRQAELEAKRRQEAAEKERKRQLEARRQEISAQLQNLATQIQQQSDSIYPEVRQELQQKEQTLKQQISNVTLVNQLSSIEQQIQEIAQKWQEAKRQKEIERQQLALENSDRTFQIIQTDAQKFDHQGLSSVQESLNQVKNLLLGGNPVPVRQPLETTQKAIAQLTQSVGQQKQAWQQRKNQAEQDLGTIQAIITGIKADEVINRWQGNAIETLLTLEQQTEKAIALENFEETANLLNQVNTTQAEIIEKANQAQLKADQRDYIADSIAETLQEMGFSIVYRQPEYAEHPASAIILGAATNSGKSISVSVPVEGEVFYDVEGYSKQTLAAVGGGSAAVCDEAEGVITEMHEVLAEQFGVKMGELNWEGKDPNRQLRQADSLPKNPSNSLRRS
ncbi:MAG: hypothetical protein RLZZ148_1358 [Cyanobacteriota bacterium]